MKKFLGVDYGQTRIGVAVSDSLGITARGIETIFWKGQDFTKPLRRLTELAAEHQVQAIVMGLPKRTDGGISETELKVKELAQLLTEMTGLEIIFKDERYTSVIANQILKTSMVKKRNKRQVVDQVAAEIILQDYLESLR